MTPGRVECYSLGTSHECLPVLKLQLGSRLRSITVFIVSRAAPRHEKWNQHRNDSHLPNRRTKDSDEPRGSSEQRASQRPSPSQTPSKKTNPRQEETAAAQASCEGGDPRRKRTTRGGAIARRENGRGRGGDSSEEKALPPQAQGGAASQITAARTATTPRRRQPRRTPPPRKLVEGPAAEQGGGQNSARQADPRAFQRHGILRAHAGRSARPARRRPPRSSGLSPRRLDGRGLMGQARTGTGKTAAFAIPLLERLADRPRQRDPRQQSAYQRASWPFQVRDEFAKLIAEAETQRRGGLRRQTDPRPDRTPPPRG